MADAALVTEDQLAALRDPWFITRFPATSSAWGRMSAEAVARHPWEEGGGSHRRRRPSTGRGPSLQWPRGASPDMARPIGPWWATPAARSKDGSSISSGRSRHHPRRCRRPCAQRSGRRIAVLRMPRPPRPSGGRCRALLTGQRSGARRIPSRALDGRGPRGHAGAKGCGMVCRSPATSGRRCAPASARRRAVSGS